MSKKIHIFADCDLDGAASLLAFYWLLRPKRASHNITRVTDFRETFLEWQKTHNVDDYEKIFILDLDVSQDSLDIADRENVVVIDHHDTHVQNKDKYKNATTIIELSDSCSKLLYQTFKDVGTPLTPEQQYLILLADDYDCYKLQLKHSYDLNVVFWNYRGDRFGKFKQDFNKGFFGFNKFQQNMIHLHAKKLKALKETIETFTATIPINKVQMQFVSTFADSCINEIAEYIIDRYNADVGMVVNLKTKKVSLRKSKECDLHLGNFSKKILEGGGHEYAAGGLLNEQFLHFTKVFKPV